MVEKITIKEKILHAFRIDRSLRLVWHASPGWTIVNICVVGIKGILPLFLLFVMKLIVDALNEGVKTAEPLAALDSVAVLILLAGGITLVTAAANQLSTYTSEVQSTIVRDYVYSLIHKKSIEVDLAYYENPEYYDTLHRAQHEGPYRPQKIVNGLIEVGQNAMTLLGMIGLLFMFHWSIGGFLFLAVVPGVVVRLIYSRRLYDWQKKRTPDQRKESYLNWLLTSDSSAKEIRLYNIGGFFAASFNALRSMLRDEQLQLRRQQSFAEFLAGGFAVLVLVGCFYAIAYRTLQGNITLGDMVMYFAAFQRGLTSLQGVLSNVASLYEDNLFVSYFYTFLEVKNSVADPDEQIRPLVPQRMARIEVKDVTFRYPGVRSAVLQNVNMTIGKGEVVALVGANGAGKSTLVKLLCRLYDPQQGKITLNGIDFRAHSQAELRRQVSTVFQDFVKYQLTVKENIWLGDIQQEVDSLNIKKAAEKADSSGFIDNLPSGYDTVLGRWFEKGEELSLGEWQKIGLSRAFLRDSQLIIFDEPASSLDPNSEYQMFSRFKELVAGHSALLISHRLSAVRMADRIYVLSNNTITETGSHDELMQKNGVYADMFRKQSTFYNF